MARTTASARSAASTRTTAAFRSGLVKNGNCETGTGSQAVDGWIGNVSFGWRIDNSQGTASYDNTTSSSGSQSLKLVKSGVNLANISNVDTNNISTTIARFGIIVKPSTSYKFSMFYKGDGTTAPRVRVVEYDSAYAFTQLGVNTLLGTENVWTNYSATFTTASTSKYILIEPILFLNGVGVDGTTANADDISLVQTSRSAAV